VHNPSHIYFTGRDANAANALISGIKAAHPRASLSFIEMDFSSLRAVKENVAQGFKHDRLDILMNNAGIIYQPPTLSTDS
jgi:NAD(P)-dependent dehydrogenase (short-subunit alcohol dehydrogenase family)